MWKISITEQVFKNNIRHDSNSYRLLCNKKILDTLFFLNMSKNAILRIIEEFNSLKFIIRTKVLKFFSLNVEQLKTRMTLSKKDTKIVREISK